MEQNRIHARFEWLKDNVWDILTFLLAVSLVFIFQVLNEPTLENLPEIATGILAVLGLLAVSGFVERNRRLRSIEELSREGRDLTKRFLSNRVSAGDFFSAEQLLTAKHLESANTVFFAGRVLARTSREFLHILGQRLVFGATVRFMVLDPESAPLLHQAALQSANTPPEFFRDTIRTTETVIDALAGTPGSTGKVELGYLPFIPSFGMTVIDPDQPHGVCLVEVYQHRSTKPHPTFEVHAQEDPYWYAYFVEQLDSLWASCRVTSLPEKASDNAPIR